MGLLPYGFGFGLVSRLCMFGLLRRALLVGPIVAEKLGAPRSSAWLKSAPGEGTASTQELWGEVGLLTEGLRSISKFGRNPSRSRSPSARE